jgi:N-acetylglucosaminyldiphosphoundecaprenol N-acetyl-beta-D-mannosaminyltransferase
MAFISSSTDYVATLLRKTARDSRKWRMDDLAVGSSPRLLAFLNAHGVNTAVRNPAFRRVLLASDYLLRDGIGVRLGLRYFGLGETDNLNGTDLIAPLLMRNRDRKIAIFGASDEALAACRARLSREGVTNIVATAHGFQADEAYLERARTVAPELLVLCMGMPRQELLAGRLLEDGFAGVIVCGGGWADFYSGVKKRAPLWMRRLSLEWLHRLTREPARLGKRYTVDLLYFFCVLLVAKRRGGNAR